LEEINWSKLISWLRAIKGLDFVGNTLEQLWLSYNEIERLDGLNNLLNLEVLYMGNNLIAKSDELNKIVIVV
jgi:dynein light chain 1